MIHNSISKASRHPFHASKTAEAHTGTTTSWLPLVTSPPTDPRCSKHLYNPDGAHYTLIAFDPWLEGAANITCLPREAAEWYTQRNLPFGATTGIVTSLGPMQCPNGYTTASSSKKNAASTMVFCCPSEYAFATSADHGSLYGCTSMQTQEVTLHCAGPTPSVATLAPRPPSRAPNVAGIAVNGWVFKPSPLFSSPLHTATFTVDGWARKHPGMTPAELSGILLGALAGTILLIITLCCLIKRKCCCQRAKPDEEGAHGAARKSSISDDEADLNPTRDVELSDLDSNGSTLASTADTVVHNIGHSKIEGSSTDDEERTA